MQDDIQLTPSPEAPDANSVQPDPNAEASDTDNGGDRIFDITEDLNIAPAVDRPVRTFAPKVPTPPSIPQAPQAAPAVTPAPVPTAAAVPMAPAVPIVANQPHPTKATPATEEFFPKATDLKALRTYETDVAEVLAHTQASRASMAIAEAKKESGQDRISNEEYEEPSHAGRKALLVILSLVLVVAGIGGAYYLYSQSALAPSTPAPQAATPAPSLIRADSQEVVLIDGLSAPVALSRLGALVNKPSSVNHITEIIPVKTTVTGQKLRVSAIEMLNQMEIAPPNPLTRSLNVQWMLGVYTDANGDNSAFVVASTNFFQNAFTGMLEWERVMADDLKQYVGGGSAAGIANVSSTTANPASSYALSGHFEDRIIMNKDVRAFVTEDGQTLFLYSFIDNTRLVIAKNESALKEIVARLENQAFIR